MGRKHSGELTARFVERADGRRVPACAADAAGVYFPGPLFPAGVDGRGVEGAGGQTF